MADAAEEAQLAATVPAADDAVSASDSVSQYDSSDAQDEWDESIRQIKYIFAALIFPILGKFIGRQVAIRLFTKYTVNRLLKAAV
ncbi:uncharacterized protein V1518DRAFT_411434 [Limtongia smithiae]|uniref:uncharacterized protein n=1 Tax=Limtongia smithiae TaxID=1125753 RepID=UPI0034CE8498